MKRNLGRIVIIYLFLSLSLLFSEDFSTTFKVDNAQPYVKEAVILTLDLNQTNHDIVLLLSFDLKPSEEYLFQRLDVKETDTHHNTKVHYTYLIYPLKAGDIAVTFDLVKKVTNDESVAYSFSGDRDNVKGLVTQDTELTLPPLVLKVKPLPKSTQLVGDFTLSQQFNKHQAKAYEPIPFQISIKGEGYKPLLEHIVPKELNVTLFTERPLVHSTHSLKGTKSTVTYPMALSHYESFDLKSITIKAFNPKTEKVYALTIPGQHFEIEKEALDTLLDKTDNPEPFSTDWSWLTTLLGYLVVFTAGYLSALSLKWRKKSVTKPSSLLQEKIEACKDPKALLQILMAADSKKFTSSIELLENGLYGKGKINFKNIKQEILEKIL